MTRQTSDRRRGRKGHAIPPLDSFEPRPQPRVRTCDHPGCQEPGDYRAPKDRSLNEYFWFCLQHVQAYNKAWNYYADLSETQMEEEIRHSTCWNRPTWPLGDRFVEGRRFDARAFKDSFDFFAEERAEERRHNRENPRQPTYREDGPRARALRILEMEPDEPLNLESLKARYKMLARRFHPDANGGDKDAEEMFKMVNEAYHTLVAALNA